jgi:hypothetical protein
LPCYRTLQQRHILQQHRTPQQHRILLSHLVVAAHVAVRPVDTDNPLFGKPRSFITVGAFHLAGASLN